MRFVELLARTNFSFLMGASHPEEMVTQAQAFGYRGLGVCDLNGLYGVARAYREVHAPSHFEKKDFVPPADFRLHVGSEMTLPEGNVTLLAINKKGYANLCRLITASKRPAPKGYSALQDDQIFFHQEGLIACPLPPWNEKRLQSYRAVFGDRLYLPVHRDFTWESHVFCLQAFEYEKRGYQLFATQRPCFHGASRKKLHDVLVCLYHKTTLREAGRLVLPNSQRRLHPLDELAGLWGDRPDLLEKTLAVSDRLTFSLNEIRYRYPQGFLPEGKTSADFLRELCARGSAERFPEGMAPPFADLVEKELKLIRDLEYEDYFLTLWEICQFAKENEILFQGRGSAANSIVCYLLGLTSVNPREIGLLFERFISKERREPPDIDVDFEHERREEVIQHIYRKYGADRAAMVCNVICFRARLAIREICKVLEIPETVVSEMVRFMGREGFQRLKESPEMFEKWQLRPETFRDVVELVSQLRGFPRHLGIHSGGFVISEDCLLENVPVEKATMEGRYVVQWNKDDVETLGLMKLDLLSLGMLTALRKCLTLLKSRKGKDWKLHNLPTDDKPTYEMIGRADTVGVFQIESRAQMSLLPRLKPRNYYDLVIEVAIVRPGPIQGGMIHPFLKNREKRPEEIDYPHPKLRDILAKTSGVPLFQEQIMQILIDVAGFKPGESDQMRRIMSNAWRKNSQMIGLKNRIYEGLRASRIPEDYIDGIYRTVEGFAAYGFPESHAASFALLTYASCYLKRHHPDVFACALLNSQPMGFYSARTLIADAQRHDTRFLPLSVQLSEKDYTLEGEMDPKGLHAVRVGFRSVAGLPQGAIERILQERNAAGPFRDLSDFVRRTRLQLPILLKIARAGAFRELGLSAREALWKLPSLCLESDSLFFAGSAGGEDEWAPPKPNEWEELSREYESQGFSLERHPLLLLRPHLRRRNQEARRLRQGLLFSTSNELVELPSGRQVRFVGLLSVQQKPPTSKGVSFLTLEDEYGFFNVVLMPNVYEKYRLMIPANPLLEITGKLEKVGGVINVIASHVHPVSRQPSPDVIKPRMFH